MDFDKLLKQATAKQKVAEKKVSEFHKCYVFEINTYMYTCLRSTRFIPR